MVKLSIGYSDVVTATGAGRSYPKATDIISIFLWLVAGSPNVKFAPH